MRHLAAYLLLVLGGNTSPTAADIKKLLGVVGVEVAIDERLLELLIKDLNGKDINALIAEGSAKLASVPSGGAAAAAPSGAAAGSAPAAAAEEKKEEKKEEEKEESDDDMGFGLFD